MQNVAETRRIVREIFQAELKIDVVHDRDNFFDLGGDSMVALMVAHSIAQRLCTDFEIADLYAHQTVEEIVEALRV